MPSPVGHALAGATVGLLVAGPSTRGQNTAPHALWWWGCAFALLGAAPDLDLLLPVEHRGASHGVGTAALVGLMAAGMTRSWRLAAAAAAAYAAHVLLDWLGTDTSPPTGVMALWPLSQAYYESHLHLFHAISRRYGSAAFWTQNVRALTRELLVLVPPFAIVLLAHARRVRRRPPAG